VTKKEIRGMIELIGRDELDELLNTFDNDLVLRAFNDGILDDLYNTSQNTDPDIIHAAFECSISFSDIDDTYQGRFCSDEEFTKNLLEDSIKVPNYVWIDWGRTARDIMMDYCEDNGHYFRCL